MTLFGPDGSVYQADIQLTSDDWAAISFGVWRCIHESGKPDRSFSGMRDQFQDHNIPFATYVFLTDDPSHQDEATDAVVADDIPVMADWEKSGCTFDEMITFVEDLRAKGNRVPLLYTGRAFWKANGSPTLTGYGLDLVVARYGNQKPEDCHEIYDRYAEMEARYNVWDWNLGGLTPVMWQFGSRVAWGDTYMDMNAIREPADLSHWFKVWTSPPPLPPSDEDDPMYLAKLSQNVPEFGLGAGGFVAGNIVVGGRHLGDIPGDTSEVFSQFCCFDMATRQPVTSWSQVTAITADEFRRRFGRRV